MQAPRLALLESHFVLLPQGRNLGVFGMVPPFSGNFIVDAAEVGFDLSLSPEFPKKEKGKRKTVFVGYQCRQQADIMDPSLPESRKGIWFQKQNVLQLVLELHEASSSNVSRASKVQVNVMSLGRR